jgi:hypothetical protein
LLNSEDGERGALGVGEHDVAAVGDLVDEVRLDAECDPPVRQRPQLPAEVEPHPAEQQLEIGEQLRVGRMHWPRVRPGRQHTHPCIPP